MTRSLPPIQAVGMARMTSAMGYQWESLYFGLQQRNALMKVSVLCPGIVRTNIAFCQRNRPPELQDETVAPSAEMAEGRARFDAVMAGAMPANVVAEQAFEAIRKEQFYVLSDAKWIDLVRLRVDKLVKLENPENPGPLAAEIVRA
jgi:short-subunit dehydrogenase